jgi:hypothetical protein
MAALSSVPLRTRIVLLGFLCAIVLISWYSFGRKPERKLQLIEVNERGRKWYAGNEDFWRALTYVDLDDRAALQKTCSALVAKRVDSPPIDEAALSRDLVEFFYAFGADSADEYMRRASEFRRVKTDLVSDQRFYTWYDAFTGEPPPPDLTAREACAIFREGIPGAPRRPMAVSEVGVLEIAWSKPLPESALGPVWSFVFPDFPPAPDAGKWVGPFSQGVPRVTEPARDFESDLRAHERLLVCSLTVALRTTDDKAFPVNLIMYFSPTDKRWHLPRFGHGSPLSWTWPI